MTILHKKDPVTIACAATSAGKIRRFKISGNLTRGQEKPISFPADWLEEMLTAFEAFKKEALQRKKAVKEKAASPKELTDWLYQQSDIIVNLSKNGI